MRNLAAIGIGPNDVDVVIISHFHGDHVSGLVAPDGGPAFPRAEITVPANEWSFWMDDGERERATPGRMQSLFEHNRQVFDPLAERVRTHAWDEEVVPGVTAIGTPGHSIGHTSYLVSSQGESVFLIQDVSNHPALSLEHPGWHLAFDQDPVAAEATRRRTLEWLAREQTAGAGLPLPVSRPRHGRGRRGRLPGRSDRLARSSAAERRSQRLDEAVAIRLARVRLHGERGAARGRRTSRPGSRCDGAATGTAGRRPDPSTESRTPPSAAP